MTANIVFDLDGTLIDSAPDIHGIAVGLMAARGLAPIDLPTARSFVGHGAPAFVAQLRRHCGLPAAEEPALLDAFLAAYADAVDLTRPYPGVPAALAHLAAGNRLGLCTNKPHAPCMAVLRHLELAGFFAAVLGGDSLPVRKPDPAPLRATFAALGPGPCVYVGDSEVDAETAERAGVPFVLFTRGYRKTPVAALPHAAAFDDFAALPGIVARIVQRGGAPSFG